MHLLIILLVFVAVGAGVWLYFYLIRCPSCQSMGTTETVSDSEIGPLMPHQYRVSRRCSNCGHSWVDVVDRSPEN